MQAAACNLISSTLVECGAAWLACHSGPELQRLHDMNLEFLLGQQTAESREQLEDCPPVQEYLQSGRREGNSDSRAACSDRDSVLAQQEFQVIRAEAECSDPPVCRHARTRAPVWPTSA